MAARREAPNHILNHGELRLQRLVSGCARPESRLIAFDVGARIGDWSKGLLEIAAGRPHGCEIHAFEPVPDSRARIEMSFPQEVARGELRINAMALSDAAGTMPMYVPHAIAGTSTLHPDSAVNYERVLPVSVGTVDEYCRSNSIPHVDLLKVDTEGNDLRVIRGAMELIERGRIGVLQFEYNHRWIYSRAYLKDVFDLIRGTPYRIAKICPGSLEIYVEWHPELERFFETNYALVHEELRSKLDCKMMRIGGSNACEWVPDAELPPLQTEPATAATPGQAQRREDSCRRTSPRAVGGHDVAVDRFEPLSDRFGR
jgi:FkbM family methyltransferase